MSHFQCEMWWWQFDCLWLQKVASEGAGNKYFIDSFTKAVNYCDISKEMLCYFEEHMLLCLHQFGEGASRCQFQHDIDPKHAVKMKTALYKRNMVKMSFLAQHFI